MTIPPQLEPYVTKIDEFVAQYPPVNGMYVCWPLKMREMTSLPDWCNINAGVESYDGIVVASHFVSFFISGLLRSILFFPKHVHYLWTREPPLAFFQRCCFPFISAVLGREKTVPRPPSFDLVNLFFCSNPPCILFFLSVITTTTMMQSSTIHSSISSSSTYEMVFQCSSSTNCYSALFLFFHPR